MKDAADAILHIGKQGDFGDNLLTYTYKNKLSAAHVKLTQDIPYDSKGFDAQKKESPCIYITNDTQPRLSAVGLTGQMTIPVDQLRRLLGNVDCFHMIVSLILFKTSYDIIFHNTDLQSWS